MVNCCYVARAPIPGRDILTAWNTRVGAILRGEERSLLLPSLIRRFENRYSRYRGLLFDPSCLNSDGNNARQLSDVRGLLRLKFVLEDYIYTNLELEIATID